jgi:hypothetical protein
MKKILFTIAMMVVGTTAFAQAPGAASANGTQGEAPKKTYEFVYSENKKVEVYDKDLGQISYNEAVEKCKNLGDGWRLPNAHELLSMVIQLKDKGKGNFYPGMYWSIEKYRENWYWGVDFGSRDNNSYCGFFDASTKFIVRPVRTMK